MWTCGTVHAAGGLTSREMSGLHPGQRCHTWGFEAQRSRGFLSILPIQVLGSNASTRSTSSRWAAGIAAPWREGLQRNIEYKRITYNIRFVVFNPWCKGAASRFSTKTAEGVSDMMRSSSGSHIDAAVRFLCVQWTPEKTRSEKLRKVS